jgi:hypothetical protein
MTIPTIALQQLHLMVAQLAGFAPPPRVAALGSPGTVNVDLLLGAQLLWTVVMGRTSISYGDVDNWISLTEQGRSPHRFAGSSFGDDSEVSADLSSMFSKLVGLAFLGEYAETCWFKVLRPLWGETLSTVDGPVHIDKPNPHADGPDYLAAPFDPSSASLGGPVYAVEFKGRKAKVEFGSDVFRGWSAQASNIALTSAASQPLNLKSWVVAFNYGFAEARGSREASTLLVEDPEISPGASQLRATRVNGASIIRDHLARQCINLGVGVLASAVKLGSGLDGISHLPAVYRVDHQRLAQRRYIGHWYAPNALGELVPVPRVSLPLGDFEFIDRGPSHLRMMSKRGGIQVVIGSNAAEPHPRGPEDLLRRLWGLGGSIFVGQDATMLRSAARTQPDAALDTTPFIDELHFKETIGDGPGAGQIQVVRNGSIMAFNVPIELGEDGFWSEP